MIVRAPVRRSCSTKRSAAPSSSGTFSKYQSLPVLVVSLVQL